MSFWKKASAPILLIGLASPTLINCDLLGSLPGMDCPAMEDGNFAQLSFSGSAEVNAKLIEILDRETRKRGILYHNLLHRDLGYTHWVELHLLFPEHTSIKEAHSIATEIENVIEQKIEPGIKITTHLESIEDHEEVHSGKGHSHVSGS